MLTPRQIEDLSEVINDEEVLGKVVRLLASKSPAAIRQKRYRDRKRNALCVTCDVTCDVTLGTIGVSSISRASLEKKEVSGCARQVEEFFDAYNVCAQELGWTIAKKISRSRRAAINRCIADAGGLEKAFDHLNDFANSKHGSEFGAGHNEREWVIGIDYVIRAGKWLEIMEGKFNGVQPQGQAINGHSHPH